MRRALHDADKPVDAELARRAEGGRGGEARQLHRAARARPGAGRGGRCRRPTRRCSARRCWCRRAIGPESPHALMAALAEKLNDRPRAIKEYEALLAVGPHQRRGRAQDVDAGGGRRRRARDGASRSTASSRSIRSTPRPTRGWGRLALKQRDHVGRDARVPRGAADRRRRQGRGALRSRRKLPARRHARPKPRRKRSRRSRSRRASSARRSCCSTRSGATSR